VKTLITADYVRQALNYDPKTGEFRWRERPQEHFHDGKYPAMRICAVWNARYAETVAGNIGYYGYHQIEIAGRLYRAHRLAWLYMTGAWPSIDIDHRDLDRANNRFANLRLATPAQNMRNTALRSTNKSGVKGVYWNKQSRKWCAQITHNGKQIHLGYFDTIEDAAATYAAAAAKYHGEFARAA